MMAELETARRRSSTSRRERNSGSFGDMFEAQAFKQRRITQPKGRILLELTVTLDSTQAQKEILRSHLQAGSGFSPTSPGLFRDHAAGENNVFWNSAVPFREKYCALPGRDRAGVFMDFHSNACAFGLSVPRNPV